MADSSILSLAALLLQQKKEKKRLAQQNRRQRESSVREGAQKIVKAWESQLEGILTRREQTASRLRKQIDDEMQRIDAAMEEMQKTMSERTAQLQSLRNQLESMKRSMDGEASSAMVMQRCAGEMRKMQEKVNAEYARKLKLIQRKNGMKKRNEIQVNANWDVKGRNLCNSHSTHSQDTNNLLLFKIHCMFCLLGNMDWLG